MTRLLHKINLIAVALCTTVVVVAANKYDTRIDGVYYTLQEGGLATVVTGDEKYAGDVTIPEEFDCAAGDFKVVAIAPKAFAGCKELRKITYPASVTTIGEGAFAGCESLKEFAILENVTFIASSAFEGCVALEEITIPASVANIGDEVFKGCKALFSAVIENKLIGENQFINCIHLDSVAISENVTTIKKKAFARCSGLHKITIPASVAKIDAEVFSGCEQLEFADIQNMTVAEKQFAGISRAAHLRLMIAPGDHAYCVQSRTTQNGVLHE